MFILKEGGVYFVFYPFCGLSEFFYKTLKKPRYSRHRAYPECVCNAYPESVCVCDIMGWPVQKRPIITWMAKRERERAKY